MSTKNLSNQEAKAKLKELVDSIDICLFSTAIKDGAMNTAPMSRQEVEADGTIWFMASVESDTCKNIEADEKVALHFANPSNYEFLCVQGKASLLRDQARVDKYWNKMMEAWFEKGKEDPSIRLIKVVPDDAQYWETKDGKVLTMLKIAASAISGQEFDTGRAGNLNL
jgi:general stress protein 26